MPVPRGALFYGEPRRRQEVAFDDALRARTEEAAKAVHALLAGGVTPPPEPGAKCRSCSLEAFCLPKASAGRSAAGWLTRTLREDDQP